ncbi:hypothetical protein UY3_02523 [Chelonia mydas]|uniref:Uncharacterized protein n=1 Tax=Chelonia mydas TaxID=8469 RepID=M7BQP0_CHEMY|nr:hypothetical protein UY3_02523 [Chelonia mydas]
MQKVKLLSGYQAVEEKTHPAFRSSHVHDTDVHKNACDQTFIFSSSFLEEAIVKFQVDSCTWYGPWFVLIHLSKKSFTLACQNPQLPSQEFAIPPPSSCADCWGGGLKGCHSPIRCDASESPAPRC